MRQDQPNVVQGDVTWDRRDKEQTASKRAKTKQKDKEMTKEGGCIKEVLHEVSCAPTKVCLVSHVVHHRPLGGGGVSESADGAWTALVRWSYGWIEGQGGDEDETGVLTPTKSISGVE